VDTLDYELMFIPINSFFLLGLQMALGLKAQFALPYNQHWEWEACLQHLMHCSVIRDVIHHHVTISVSHQKI